MNDLRLKPIAYIHSDFPEKFGIPRQSGLAETTAAIIFESNYRNPDAFRNLEDYSYIWLLWGFSENPPADHWHATVRPPKLGGNTRVGVFASRSPFRPNPIGLSSVKLERIEYRPVEGPVLIIMGADLLDGTPIYDIKPYLPYADSHPDAACGFAGQVGDYQLDVHFPEDLLALIPSEKRNGLLDILKEDPRPSYHNDPDRIYGVAYANFNIRFRVDHSHLYVIQVINLLEVNKTE